MIETEREPCPNCGKPGYAAFEDGSGAECKFCKHMWRFA